MRNCGLALARVPLGAQHPADLCPVALARVHTVSQRQAGDGWAMRKSEAHVDRTQRIVAGIRELLGRHQRPALVCYEQFSSKNAVVMIQMGHVIGALSALAHEWRSPMIARTPAEVKQAAGCGQRRIGCFEVEHDAISESR